LMFIRYIRSKTILSNCLLILQVITY